MMEFNTALTETKFGQDFNEAFASFTSRYAQDAVADKLAATALTYLDSEFLLGLQEKEIDGERVTAMLQTSALTNDEHAVHTINEAS